MNTEWLRDFQTLAETGNFTLAAKKQNVSQAAFSRRIQALENWVGTKLIDRNQYPISITDAGKQFLYETGEVLLKLNETRTSISNPDLGIATHINIAMPQALANSQFAKWWQSWSEGTRTSVSLSLGNVTDMVAKFITGSTDILICYNSNALPILQGSEDYLCHEIEKDMFSPYVSRKFAKQYESRFPGTESSPVPLLRYSKGAYFSKLQDIIIKQSPMRLNGITQLEADMSSVIQRCITSGLGIGWLPQSSIEPHYEKLIRKVYFEGWNTELSIQAYMHKNNINTATGIIWDRITKQFRPA